MKKQQQWAQNTLLFSMSNIFNAINVQLISKARVMDFAAKQKLS